MTGSVVRCAACGGCLTIRVPVKGDYFCSMECLENWLNLPDQAYNADRIDLMQEGIGEKL